ncbi:MAG: hypothetical protein ACTSRU_05450 [Candidatus Hodarchaeales archaeon]
MKKLIQNKQRIKNIRSSIKKWNRSAWSELDQYQRLRSNRAMTFTNVMWQVCGFCFEFKTVSSRCDDCPLSSHYCNVMLQICIEKNNAMGKIRQAWLDDNEKEFHIHRLELIKFMALQLVEDKK